MLNSRIGIFTISAFVLASVVGCSTSEPSRDEARSGNLRTVENVIGTAGGQVDFGDGTILTVPAGALAEDVRISVSKRGDARSSAVAGIQVIRIGPTSLVFGEPATLTVAYDVTAEDEPGLIGGYAYDELAQIWSRLDVVEKHAGAGTVDFVVTQAAWISTIFDRPLDLVLDIPGKYLRRSDLLYCLALTTGIRKFTWFPGHVGMFIGSPENSDTENNGSTIIESAPPDGVGLSSLGEFRYDSNHLFMGARRLNGSLTVADESNVAAYAFDKIGRGYCLVGQGNLFEGNYSCVGLTEASYDAAGKSIVPAHLEIPFIIPLEQFVRTRPVDEIVVEAGDLLRISVKAVVWDADEHQYVDDASVFIASASGLPNGATFVGNVLEWTPGEPQVGATYSMLFEVTAESGGSSYTKSRNFAVTVTSRAADSTSPAAITNLTVSTATSGSVALAWSAPGDDGSAGTAAEYDIRYSTAAITSGNWAAATQVTGAPAPLVAGTPQSFIVTGLMANTVYFLGLMTRDEAGNWSPLSNVVAGTTTQIERVPGFEYIMPGVFMMGSPLGEARRFPVETQHQVTLTRGFYMSRYEVTEELWYDAMGGTPTTSQLPKDYVSWDMAVQFCNVLSIREGLTPAYTIHGPGGNVTWHQDANGYRLPTEAEWEYACRATTTAAFNNDTNCLSSDTEANFAGSYDYDEPCVTGIYRGERTVVGGFPENQWGLYDMHGNLWEWVWCGWRDYTSDAQINPVTSPSYTPTTVYIRVARGGGWDLIGSYCRSAMRSSALPENASRSTGFRLARSSF